MNPPKERDVRRRLGRAGDRWAELLARLAEVHGPLTETWKFYKHWTLQVQRKKRTVVWLTPHEKYFLASTALGDKAAAAARRSDLPAEVKRMIRTAKKYAEGRACRIEIRTKRDVETVLDVAALKMAN